MMIPRFLLIILCLCCAPWLAAQHAEPRFLFPGSAANEVSNLLPLPDGRYFFVSAESEAPPSMEAVAAGKTEFIIRNYLNVMDAQGKVLVHEPVLQGMVNTMISSVCQTPEGFIVVGRVRKFRDDYALLAGFDTDFRLRWVDSASHPGILNHVSLLNDSQFVATGGKVSGVILARGNLNGKILSWNVQRSEDNTGWYSGNQLAVAGKNVLVACGMGWGHTQETFGIMSLDRTGGLRWKKSLCRERGEAVLIRAAGDGCWVAGRSSSYTHTGMLARITAEGDTLHTCRWGGQFLSEHDITPENYRSTELLNRLAAEIAIRPQDMLVLADGSVLVLCSVSVYANPHQLDLRTENKTVAIYRFSAAGELVQGSVLPFFQNCTARGLAQAPGDKLLVFLQTKEPSAGLFLSIPEKTLFDRL